jgi:5-formyltetrahydrofolate cyclo-ligase
MNKAQIRKEFKSLRNQLTPQQIEEYSLQIANQALNLDIWNLSTYHIFLSITHHKEVNTEYLLHVLQGTDKHIVISKTDFETYHMRHYLLTDQTRLTVNDYGIPEPDDNGIQINDSKIDVVFVPLLACDFKGNRLGYGKGFYDRFLKNCRPNVIKIGLSFFEPLNYGLPFDEYDQTLDYLITPDRFYRFNDKPRFIKHT